MAERLQSIFPTDLYTFHVRATWVSLIPMATSIIGQPMNCSHPSATTFAWSGRPGDLAVAEVDGRWLKIIGTTRYVIDIFRSMRCFNMHGLLEGATHIAPIKTF